MYLKTILFYCLKCKKKQKKNKKLVKTRNGRIMLLSNCTVSNSKKNSRFFK